MNIFNIHCEIQSILRLGKTAKRGSVLFLFLLQRLESLTLYL